MKIWTYLILIALIMMSVLTVVQGGNSAVAGVRANEKIWTDKPVYVMGENIIVYIHGDANTTYYIFIDGSNGPWPHWSITTNSTGDGNKTFYTNNFNVGTHTIDMRDSHTSNTVLASTKIEIRQGLAFWPSEYTHTTNKYLSGETLWVKLTGENSKEYLINITDNKGNVVYPTTGNNMSVTTDSSGVVVFNVSLNMGDGNYYMNLYNGSNYIQREYFEVTSVDITVKIDKGVYLLSEKMHVFVTIYWMKTHSVLKGASYNWWFINASDPNENYGSYPEDKNEFYTQPLNKYENATGKKIGVNQEYILRVEYNETNSTGKHYARVDVYFYTGHLYASISNNPLDGSLSPGKRVKTDLRTSVRCDPYWEYSSIGNVNVEYLNITATNHWKLLWFHNYTNLGKTDVAGHMDIIWRIPSLEIGTKIDINTQVSIENEKYKAQGTFYIESGASSSLQLDKDMYLSGDTMDIKVITKTPSNVKAVNFEYGIYGGDKLLFYESTSSDEIKYTIPVNFSGELNVVETTYFSTGDVDTNNIYTDVYYGYLYLQSSQPYYKEAGDEIDIYTDFESNVMHPAQYIYKVIDDHGKIISETNTSSTTYAFTVPSVDSDYYKVMVEAIDGSYYTSNSIVIERFVGFEVYAHIVTESRYQNMIYEPGEKIKISYSIVKYGDFTPHNLLLHWAIVGTDYHWSKMISESELQGYINLKIPKDVRGHTTIEVWVEDSEYHPSTYDLLGVNVQYGSWAMQDILGMPMATFINLILVIIALVIGIVIVFILLKGRGGGFTVSKKKSAPKPFEVEEKKEVPEEKAPEIEEEGPEV